MKKTIKFITILVVLTLLLSFAGCGCGLQFEPGPYSDNNMELYTIAAFSIPFADEMGTSVEIMEKDSYGRILFGVRFGSSLFYQKRSDEQEWMYGYVICQKYDKENTYYYEDDCFRIYYSEDMFTSSEQKELKDINDWDAPLNDEKMTSRNIIKKGKTKLSATPLGSDKSSSVSMNLDDVFLKNHPMSEQNVYSEYLDCDKNGNSIGIVWTYSTSPAGDIEVEAYFIIVGKDVLDTNNASIERIKDTLRFWEEIKRFKQENGWAS